MSYRERGERNFLTLINMPDIGLLLTAGKQIYDALNKVGKSEMAESVISLSQTAYDQMSENMVLKEQIQNLKGQIIEKEKTIKELNDIAHLKKTLVFKNDCYWDDKGFAICSACLEKPEHPALIRMQTDGRSDGLVTCPICKNHAWSKGEIKYIESSSPNFDPYSAI